MILNHRVYVPSPIDTAMQAWLIRNCGGAHTPGNPDGRFRYSSTNRANTSVIAFGDPVDVMRFKFEYPFIKYEAPEHNYAY
jgi:hypothetical protein